MTLLDIIKKELAPGKLTATVLAGATVAVLATETLATALYVAAAIAFMLIVSAAVASALGKVTDEVGIRVVHLAVSAFTAMACAAIYAIAEVDVGADFAIIMAVSAVSGVIMYSCPQKGDSVLKTVISSAITAIFYAVLLVMTALIREFFGSGAYLGKEIMPHDVPFLLLPAGGLITLGILAAFINIIVNVIEKTRSAIVEKAVDKGGKATAETETEVKSEAEAETEAETAVDALVDPSADAADEDAENNADENTEDNGDA